MQSNEYEEPYKELNVQEYVQKLVKEEAKACVKYGLKPGSIAKSIFEAYERERLQKELDDGFTPYPDIIGVRSDKFG